MWFPWATFLESDALNARLKSETGEVCFARGLQVAAVRPPWLGSYQFLAQCLAALSPGKLTLSFAVEARFISIDS